MFRYCFFFFFNDTATTEIYTLSLHDALPISVLEPAAHALLAAVGEPVPVVVGLLLVLAHDLEGDRLAERELGARSEEHTSELQSRQYLVCRLLLEKKKKPDEFPIHMRNMMTQ